MWSYSDTKMIDLSGKAQTRKDVIAEESMAMG